MALDLTVSDLLDEYDRALGYTSRLWTDLDGAEVTWRPDEKSSAIAWHLGHQAATAHFMVRNLTAAEPSLGPQLDQLFDSATPEPARGDLPPLGDITAYRSAVAARVRFRLGAIAAGDTAAPAQMDTVGRAVLRAVINHEYQHDKWIGEVRSHLGHEPPTAPKSTAVVEIDGYLVVA